MPPPPAPLGNAIRWGHRGGAAWFLNEVLAFDALAGQGEWSWERIKDIALDAFPIQADTTALACRAIRVEEKGFAPARGFVGTSVSEVDDRLEQAFIHCQLQRVREWQWNRAVAQHGAVGARMLAPPPGPTDAEWAALRAIEATDAGVPRPAYGAAAW